MLELFAILVLVLGLGFFVYTQMPPLRLPPPHDTILFPEPCRPDEPKEIPKDKKPRRLFPMKEGFGSLHQEIETPEILDPEVDLPSLNPVRPFHQEEVLPQEGVRVQPLPAPREHPFLAEWSLLEEGHPPICPPWQPPQAHTETQTESESKPLPKDHALQTSGVIPVQEDLGAASPLLPLRVDQSTQTEEVDMGMQKPLIRLPSIMRRPLLPQNESLLSVQPFSLRNVQSVMSHDLHEEDGSELIESPVVSSHSQQNSSELSNSVHTSSKEEALSAPPSSQPSRATSSKQTDPPHSDPASSYVVIPKPNISTMSFSILPDPEDPTRSVVVVPKGKPPSQKSSSSYDEVE